MIKIRKMKVEDSLEVARIQVESWRSSYKNILSEDYLHSMKIEKKASLWMRGFMVNSDIVRLVALDKKDVVGYLCGLENRSKEAFPSVDCELWALYVRPDYWHRGIGKMLFDTFTCEMNKLKYHSMLIWVLEDNHRARSFYEKMGGQLSLKTKNILLGDQNLIQVAYEFDIESNRYFYP